MAHKQNVMAGTAPNVGNDEYRMFLQLDTSLLEWLRTSLGLMGFGFVIARFGLFLREIAQANQVDVHPHAWLTQANTLTGTGLIVVGIVVLLIAVWNHRQVVDRLHRGELALPPHRNRPHRKACCPCCW
jgi:putative membrane protein